MMTKTQFAEFIGASLTNIEAAFYLEPVLNLMRNERCA